MRQYRFLTAALIAGLAVPSLAGTATKEAGGHEGDEKHAQHGHAHSPAREVIEQGTQTTCPVMGGKINKKIFADHHGKRVYFCCNACVETFKKDPEKYLKKLEANDERPATLARVPQATCPVMGGAVNKKLYVDHDGKRIYVCCGACLDAVKKEPEKYLKKLSDLGEKAEKL